MSRSLGRYVMNRRPMVTTKRTTTPRNLHIPNAQGETTQKAITKEFQTALTRNQTFLPLPNARNTRAQTKKSKHFPLTSKNADQVPPLAPKVLHLANNAQKKTRESRKTHGRKRLKNQRTSPQNANETSKANRGHIPKTQQTRTATALHHSATSNVRPSQKRSCTLSRQMHCTNTPVVDNHSMPVDGEEAALLEEEEGAGSLI